MGYNTETANNMTTKVWPASCHHTAILLSLLMAVSLLQAQDITFMPQWTPQAQFAGFYVAYEKGFYADEGLNVNIVHTGQHSTESIADMLESGDIHIGGMQTMQAIVSRSKGVPLVNIMQITQNTGLCCVSHTPLHSVADLSGKKTGKWKKGYYEVCEILATKENVDIDWVSFVNGINLFVYGAIDATLCFSFNELIRLELAMGDIPQENVLHFSETGYSYPEDGLWVTESYWKQNREAIEKFARASIRGWKWANENKEETLEISRKYVNEGHVATNDILESMMLDEYLRLQTNPHTGNMDYEKITEDVFDRIVNDLYNAGLIGTKVEYDKIIRR